MTKLETYRGVDGQWYWRARARNGQVTATGGEGYISKSNARRAARRIGAALVVARCIEVQPRTRPGDYNAR